jgi:hypothetical protein
MVRTFATKVCHSSGLKVSAPSPGFLESCTATLPLRVWATSTQFAPVLL